MQHVLERSVKCLGLIAGVSFRRSTPFPLLPCSVLLTPGELLFRSLDRSLRLPKGKETAAMQAIQSLLFYLYQVKKLP